MALFSAVLQAVPFDGDHAFYYLQKQLEFGPRIPGSTGNAACRDWIIDLCNESADTVICQNYNAYDPFSGDTVKACNIIARFDPKKTKRFMLSTHWDTRPVADHDPVKFTDPVPGANDGASGTAVLLELLPFLATLDAAVDVVFWDAEDMGLRGGEYFCQGSEYYAQHPVSPVPQQGILIDMIGDADLLLPIEQNSLLFAPKLAMSVWNLAKDLGYGDIFQRKMGPNMFDDHVPLNQIGIKTIDIIDFDYKCQGQNAWHTVNDLPGCCSPQSLEVIGTVLAEWMSR